MEDQQAEVLEFDEAVASVSSGPTKQVLEHVGLARARADETHGYFRDYADADTAAKVLWTASDQVQAEVSATTGRRSWLGQLFVTVGLVSLLLGTGPYSERRLREALVQVAELAVAWIEAIDQRTNEKRVTMMAMKPPSLWWRLKRWWRERRSR